ncbi:MAG: Ig-like domain-containing protein [Oscillospiraceae bacterium]|nr:Ig-like domain-containing protein [Oscillospiraceae bacterium]
MQKGHGESMKNIISKLTGSIKKKPLVWGLSLGGFVVACAVVVLIINQPGEHGGELHNRRGTDDIPINSEIDETERTGRTSAPGISSLLTSVVAEQTTGRVIDTDTAFRITTAQPLTAARLKPMLALEPAVNFELTELGDTEFKLIVSEALPEDSIVRLTLLDEDGQVERRWAFQTAAVFKINSTLPGNEREHVPVNTGIEISFSAEVNPSVMSGYFSIEPEVSGRFQRFRNTVVFVPGSDLAEDTVYTVTVKAGLPSADGFTLEEDHEFSFRTWRDWNSDFFHAGGGISETFIPGDPVVLEIYCSAPLGGLTYDVNLYQFGSAPAYREVLDSFIAGSSWQRSHIIGTESLTNIYSSAEQLLRAKDDNSDWSWGWRPSFILLPDNLEEGYYIADVKTEHGGVSYHAQKLIQINPVSVYASSLPNETYFFINDTTENPAAFFDIEMNFNGKNFSAQTDANGIAHVEVSALENGRGILSVQHNKHYPFIDIFDFRARAERTPEENYFLHLYTDRETYKTTDEILVWGVVIPRERGIPMPADLTLQAGEAAENRPVAVTLSPDGTFTASINLQSNAETWWYPIDLISGGEVMARKRITVRDYVKPSYVFDVNVPFYAWMPHQNPVDVSLQASFFEGTPAKGLDFSVYCWQASNSENALATDEKGFAETSLLINNTSYDKDTWRPSDIGVTFVLSGIENEYQHKMRSFFALFRDVMLESDYNADTRTLSITTSMVDPENFVPQERVDNTRYYGYNYSGWGWYGWYGWYWNSGDGFSDMLRGAPVNVTVTGTLNRSWTEQIEQGTYYDFIQKQTFTSYRYERREEIVGTFTTDTVNGAGAFVNLPANIEGSHYYIELEWHDTQGQLVKETVYLYDNSRWSWRGDTSVHSYNLVSDSRDFTENQKLSLQLEDNGTAVSSIPANARIFYAVSGSEFITSGIERSPAFSHTMTDEYIPNVYISGAYFDGRHVFPLAVNQYFFDSSEREIIIEVTTDKDKYRPAEPASVTVTARDLQGRTVPGARVSLSAVDEAAFAVQDQHINTLRMIYAYTYIPNVQTYHSYVQHSLFGNSPGEKGGGGDGDTQVRRNFKENAAFLTGTTDENGTAVFSIGLPDNLTSWRLTVQVVGENADGKLSAGNIKQPLIVTIPLFLTVNSLPEYILGDDVTLSARVNGQNIPGNPQINATITGGGIERTATALSDEPLSFGKLPLGEYVLLVQSTDYVNMNSDAVELPLAVVDSLLETPVSKTLGFTEVQNITPLRYPMSLTFFDSQYTLYSNVLSYLYRSWGERSDYRVARAFASLELGHIDEEWLNELLADITTADYLIRLLPYGDPELPLSALMAAAAPDIVNRAALTRSFYNVLTSSNSRNYGYSNYYGEYSAEETTYAYLGLAAFGEPVLTDILSLLEDPAGLKAEDKLRLTAALALLGDEQSALKYYLELTEDFYKEYTDIRTLEEHVIIGDNHKTSLALLTAGALNLPEAEGIVRHLLSAPVTEQTFMLELMTYLRHYNPKIEGSATFTYNLYGSTETITLGRFTGTTLSFGREQLENADFNVISGDIGIRAFYIGSVSEIEEAQSLNVSKTYALEEGDWGPGSLVKVTITVPNAPPDSWISIQDVIPSGARWAGSDSGWFNRSLQRVNGGFSTWRNNSRSASYFIRLVNSGEFVSESAVARDHDGNWGMSEQGVLVIE